MFPEVATAAVVRVAPTTAPPSPVFPRLGAGFGPPAMVLDRDDPGRAPIGACPGEDEGPGMGCIEMRVSSMWTAGIPGRY